MKPARVEINEIVQIFDELFELEVLRGLRPPRLVESGDRDPGGARLRARLVHCGWECGRSVASSSCSTPCGRCWWRGPSGRRGIATCCRGSGRTLVCPGRKAPEWSGAGSHER
jgi:hypothetical protein